MQKRGTVEGDGDVLPVSRFLHDRGASEYPVVKPVDAQHLADRRGVAIPRRSEAVLYQFDDLEFNLMQSAPDRHGKTRVASPAPFDANVSSSRHTRQMQ